MIRPTVGRVVHYYRDRSWRDNQEQPQAAIITCVHRDDLVNLAVFGATGYLLPSVNIFLLQDDHEPPESGPFCQWMPYQKSVAAGEIAPTLHAS